VVRKRNRMANITFSVFTKPWKTLPLPQLGQLVSGLGFDGITVALLGKTHPFGVIPAAILIGALRAGSSQMQFSAGVAKEITDVIIALMLFFVAADQIVRWILRGRLPEDDEKITISTSWGQ